MDLTEIDENMLPHGQMDVQELVKGWTSISKTMTLIPMESEHGLSPLQKCRQDLSGHEGCKKLLVADIVPHANLAVPLANRTVETLYTQLLLRALDEVADPAKLSQAVENLINNGEMPVESLRSVKPRDCELECLRRIRNCKVAHQELSSAGTSLFRFVGSLELVVQTHWTGSKIEHGDTYGDLLGPGFESISARRPTVRLRHRQRPLRRLPPDAARYIRKCRWVGQENLPLAEFPPCHPLEELPHKRSSSRRDHAADSHAGIRRLAQADHREVCQLFPRRLLRDPAACRVG